MDRPSELPGIKPPDTTAGLPDIPIKPPGQTKTITIGWGTSGAPKTGQDIKEEFELQAAREKAEEPKGKVLASAEINDAMKQLRQQKNWERKAALALGLDSRKITEMPEDELYAKLKSVGFHF